MSESSRPPAWKLFGAGALGLGAATAVAVITGLTGARSATKRSERGLVLIHEAPRAVRALNDAATDAGDRDAGEADSGVDPRTP